MRFSSPAQSEIGRLSLVETDFDAYRIVQDRLFESDLNRLIQPVESSGKPDIDKEWVERPQGRTHPLGATSKPNSWTSTEQA
jgi:hypothetical protein